MGASMKVKPEGSIIFDAKRTHITLNHGVWSCYRSYMFPFLGATDGLVTCACCGNGILEIKCLFTCQNKELREVAEENSRFFWVTKKMALWN